MRHARHNDVDDMSFGYEGSSVIRIEGGSVGGSCDRNSDMEYKSS